VVLELLDEEDRFVLEVDDIEEAEEEIDEDEIDELDDDASEDELIELDDNEEATEELEDVDEYEEELEFVLDVELLLEDVGVSHSFGLGTLKSFEFISNVIGFSSFGFTSTYISK